MLSFRFNSVRIESFGLNLPTEEVTSADIEKRLAPLYERLKIPFGTLEKLTGVGSRYFWKPDVMPSQVATVAAHNALESIGFSREQVKGLFSCSITRDYFEPATACLIHNDLGIAEDSIVLDVTNACLGFMNGLFMMGNLIESGIIKAGIVVSGEAIIRPMEHCMEHLLKRDDITRDELVELLPTLTLGSGAVAYVLAHESIATPSSHKIKGGVLRSATRFHNLCNGNGDYYIRQQEGFAPIMTTESAKLLSAAASLGGRCWEQCSEVLGWKNEDINHIFCHQVGKQVNEAFYREMGLEYSKEFTIYRKYGNLASAALPTALIMGSQEKGIKQGEKVLLTGFGSGLNSLFMGLEW